MSETNSSHFTLVRMRIYILYYSPCEQKRNIIRPTEFTEFEMDVCIYVKGHPKCAAHEVDVRNVCCLSVVHPSIYPQVDSGQRTIFHLDAAKKIRRQWKKGPERKRQKKTERRGTIVVSYEAAIMRRENFQVFIIHYDLYNILVGMLTFVW